MRIRSDHTGRLLALLLLLAAVGWGCSSDSTAPEPDPDPVPTSIRVTPTSVALEAIGATASVAAVVQDQDGAPFAGASVTWSSLDVSVATVTAGGQITATGIGATTVRATSGSLTADVSVTVSQTPANVVVTPATGELSPGATLALSAAVRDTNGNDVAEAVVAWSTGDAAVATVDATTGLVTAVAEGSTTVTATAGPATGEAAITVLAPPPDLVIDADSTLGGTVNVGAFTIASGVTVTLSDDLVLNAAGPVSIAGSMTGNCVGLAVAGTATLTLDGADVDTRCATSTSAADAAPLRLLVSGEVTVRESTVRGAGAVLLGNTEPDELPDFLSLSRASPYRSVAFPTSSLEASEGVPNTCIFDNSTIEGADVRDAGDPPAGRTARSVRIGCSGNALFQSVQVLGAHGADGTPVEVAGSLAEGQPGEGGGTVLLDVEGELDIRGGVQLRGGDAGNGGSATATPTDPGSDATASGGFGGLGGLTIVRAAAVRIDAASELRLSIGRFGDGGAAVAVGADGDPGEPGGSATAIGAGFDQAYESGAFQIVGAGTALIQTGDLDPASAGRIRMSPVTMASGGDATAIGGRGGDGLAPGIPGEVGGTATARGGDGGHSPFENSRPEIPTFEVTLGSGGSATWGGGRGGDGVSDFCGEGSDGGGGGSAVGAGGEAGTPEAVGGGPLDGVTLVPGNAGLRLFQEFGNGGNGGSGTIAVGAAGVPGSADPGVLDDLAPEATANSFEPGAPGAEIACERLTELAAELSIPAGGDPGGHGPFVKFQNQTLLRLNLQLAAFTAVLQQPGLIPVLLGTITAPGGAPAGPEGAVTPGTYSFDLSGTGTVAGFSDVLVVFTGTMSVDDQGSITSLTGEMVVDPDAEKLPPNGMGVRHPLIYEVTGTPQSGAPGR